MSTLANIQLGYKAQAWFNANPTFILKMGQTVFLLQTGQFKIGDGVTQLQNLSFLGVPYSSNNGITLTGSNFQLGGALVQNTDINGAFTLNLGTSGSKLTNLISYASANIRFFSSAAYLQLGSTGFLSGDASGNNYFYANAANYNEIAHTVQNLYSAPLHQFSGTNLQANLTGVVDINTDNGVYNTPSLYLDPTNNTWDIGSVQAQFVGQLTQVDFIGQYFNMNATQIMPQLTPNRALYLDASKFIKTSSVTDTELGYLSGVTSGIQSQFASTNITSKILTGLSVTGGTIVSTDTILQAFGKLQNQVNAVAGAMDYQGTWNANTNSPTLASGAGTKGYVYRVSVSGSTNLDGITDWKAGDFAVFNGTAWDKWDSTDAVTSVNGYVGTVTLVSGDISETSNLYFTNARVDSRVQAYTGDITLSGTSFAIGSGKVTNAMLAGSITAAKLVGTDIATVGTITAGIWQGTSISTTYTDAKIKGAATTGQLLYASATDTAATSANLAWDNSNLRLNVGQASGASAAGTLMVKTTGANTALQIHSGLGSTFLSWHDSATSAYRLAQNLDASGNWVVYRATGSAGSETFTEAMRIVNSSGRSVFNAPVGLKSYTVSTLPTGTRGDTAYVTDALAPTYLVAVTGGGAVVTPVFYDGTNWVAF